MLREKAETGANPGPWGFAASRQTGNNATYFFHHTFIVSESNCFVVGQHICQKPRMHVIETEPVREKQTAASAGLSENEL